jgi:hypothetical protein
MSWLIIFTIISVGLSPFTIADDPCRFEDSLNGVIDLSTLAAIDGTAAYQDRQPTTPTNYSTFIFYSFTICY